MKEKRDFLEKGSLEVFTLLNAMFPKITSPINMHILVHLKNLKVG
jgi:hypothetical protein